MWLSTDRTKSACSSRTDVLIYATSWKLKFSGTCCPRNSLTKTRAASSPPPVLAVPSLIALKKSPGGRQGF